MSARRDCRLPAPVLAVLAALLVLLGGCAGTPGSVTTESHLSFDRTFDLARAALTDQKLAIGTQDRRTGVIVGNEGAITITATVQPQAEGPIRVTFSQQPEGADPALLKRVTEAYRTRLAQFGILDAFKGLGGSGGGGSGPVPCPSGPAFCP